MEVSLSRKQLQSVIGYFLMACIIVGCILHIVPFFYNRSMWIDEAMLASSVCTRSLSELFTEVLDWGQSASIGWLLLTKITTMIFGASEAALRIWSLIPSFACMVVMYCTIKEKASKNYALLFTAVFALTDRYIYYGNEVKPYMLDNLTCLVVLLLWQKYKCNKISLGKLSALFSILIWFSFSAVFFIAACMMIECFNHVICFLKHNSSKQSKKQSLVSLTKCGIVLLSFVLNYILWLSRTSSNAGGAEYWNLLRFPLIPTSVSDVKLILKMALQFFAFCPLWITVLLCFLLVIYSVVSLAKKEDKSCILLPFYLSLILLFVASFMGFYPIQDRLVQVYLIVVLEIVAFSCDMIGRSGQQDPQQNMLSVNQNWLEVFFVGILTLCLAMTGMNGCKNLFASHVYKSGSEVAENMAYLTEYLSDKDTLYVFRYSIPVYQYEIGYGTTYRDVEDLPVLIDNTIYGQTLVSYFYDTPYSYANESKTSAVTEDSELILQHDSVYIFTSHGEAGVKELLEELEKYGTVEIANESHGTRLYHFCKKA